MEKTITIEFTEITCCNCGCVFTLPTYIKKQRLEDKEYFYCYNGHPQHYKKSTSDILKEEKTKLLNDISKQYSELLDAKKRINELTRKKRPATRVTNPLA